MPQVIQKPMSRQTDCPSRRLLPVGLLCLASAFSGCTAGERAEEPAPPSQAQATVEPTIQHYRVPVFALAFCADGKQLATGGAPWHKPAADAAPHYWGRGEVKVWDMPRGALLFELKKDLTPNSQGLQVVFSLSYLPDHGLLVGRSGETVAYDDGDHGVMSACLSLWDLATRKERTCFTDGIGADRSLKRCFDARQINKAGQLAFSADGHYMARTTCSPRGDIWDLSNADSSQWKLGYAQAPAGVATCAAISPDKKQAASGGGPDQAVVIWQIVPRKAGNVVATLKHDAIVNRIEYTADGRTLAALDESGVLKLWNLTTHKARHTIQAHQGDAFALAVSPDGRLIATGGVDKVIKLWDAATGQVLASQPQQKGRIQALAFSPDGKLLASSACDPFEKGEVRIWETTRLLSR